MGFARKRRGGRSRKSKLDMLEKAGMLERLRACVDAQDRALPAEEGSAPLTSYEIEQLDRLIDAAATQEVGQPARAAASSEAVASSASASDAPRSDPRHLAELSEKELYAVQGAGYKLFLHLPD